MGLPKPSRKNSNFQKNRIEFLKTTEGQHTLRFLSPLAGVTLFYTHWINGGSVECLGDDCPVCQGNQVILVAAGDWETAKKNKDFRPYQVRYYVNILDRTPVKVHPDSEKMVENKRDASAEWPSICSDTGLSLAEVEVKPSNRVKVLAGGVTLFEAVEAIDMSIVVEKDDEEVPLGVENFDIVLMVSGSGREKKTTPIPQATRNDKVSVDEDKLHDLNKALLRFTAPELQDFIRGVSIRDIFAARSAREDNVESPVAKQAETEVNLLSSTEDELKESISDLLK